MTDIPILFSGVMVRSLLSGRKTQTRRAIKPQPTFIESSGRWKWEISKAKQHGCDAVYSASREWHEYLLPHQRPWHAVGDRLWVKETWSGRHEFRTIRPAERESFTTPDGPVLREDVWYWADGNPTGGDYEKPRVSIHMPRWASRITLIVEGVKVERLQDISEDDAIAEGVVDMGRRDGEPYSHCHLPGVPSIRMEHDAVPVYSQLWEMINGEGSWAANPWVVAYTFRVVMGNIDQIGGEA